MKNLETKIGCNDEIKPYEKLTLANDIVFCKVMRVKELCRHLLEIILDVKINEIVYSGIRGIPDDLPDGKVKRFNLYAVDDKGTIYDIELHEDYINELPQRAGYYHAIIDKEIIRTGVSYDKLPDCYVIFICLFDPFGRGEGKYQFLKCEVEDPDIKLDDGSYTVFLNTKGTAQNPELQNFLNYLEDETNISDEFTKKLDETVKFTLNNKK